MAKWIDCEPDKKDYDYKKSGMSYKCSSCGHRAGKFKHETYHFCPWCGANMQQDLSLTPLEELGQAENARLIDITEFANKVTHEAERIDTTNNKTGESKGWVSIRSLLQIMDTMYLDRRYGNVPSVCKHFQSGECEAFSVKCSLYDGRDKYCEGYLSAIETIGETRRKDG